MVSARWSVCAAMARGPARGPARLPALLSALAMTLAPVEGRAQRAAERSAGVMGRVEWVVAAGTIAATAVAWPLDQRVRDWVQAPARQGSGTLGSMATGLNSWGDPGSVIVPAAVWLVGRVREDRATSVVGLRAGEAVVVSGIVGGAIKAMAGRARPYASPRDPRDLQFLRGRRDNRWQSFPSGHTTAAFAVASAMTAEWGRQAPRSARVAGPLLYALAAGTAWARLHDDKHWLSDVAAGAGLGTLSGLTVVRWHARHPGSRVDRWLLPAPR